MMSLSEICEESCNLLLIQHKRQGFQNQPFFIQDHCYPNDGVLKTQGGVMYMGATTRCNDFNPTLDPSATAGGASQSTPNDMLLNARCLFVFDVIRKMDQHTFYMDEYELSTTMAIVGERDVYLVGYAKGYGFKVVVHELQGRRLSEDGMTNMEKARFVYSP